MPPDRSGDTGLSNSGQHIAMNSGGAHCLEVRSDDQ